MAPHDNTMMDIAKDRDYCLKLIIDSNSPKKLIVGGPGTGKTRAFHDVLAKCGGGGLALTFINNLVNDLQDGLGGLAEARTFHGFCKRLLHRTNVDGVNFEFDYYPPLKELIAQDLNFLGRSGIDSNVIEQCLQDTDDNEGIISEVLRLGSYYNAVAHTDSVYRMLRHLEQHKDDIPQYPLIIVDEYQDFTLLETSFIKLLAEKNPILITGDDDQALYSFRHASTKYIRDLAQDSSFTKFELPYCSRCTQVIVDGVGDVLKCAESLGLLQGRIQKPFYCYLPDKQEDSQRYPDIIHAHCTVESTRAPYIGRYVASQIEQIPDEEIIESHRGGYPTALIIGPSYFVSGVHAVLEERFPYIDVEFRKSSKLEVSIFDGYERLVRNEESRLGWRIILYCDPFDETDNVILNAISNHINLSSIIPSEYKMHHLKVAGIVGKIRRDEPLTEVEESMITSSTGFSLGDIKKKVVRSDDDPDEEEVLEESSVEFSEAGSSPSIVCTSLPGAKGLSASYVFIVGLNNGHFPQNPTDIDDDEVCQLLVGLSRTRKQSHLVSCGHYGGNFLRQSIFLSWLHSRLSRVTVDKNYS